ncbi:tRNA (adenosine(37)-N6)-threonylcarbamoyltransferase complex dimerization subunit type 1 TsaB [Corynebacterium flavescens]|uniref:tRNA (adenosine(37)-N6)-threonylcarbamoyltransferase complex dimerization subunit type 1 TsaB n=1 Tax=Corynebacterium flavescens TaxID=28028 RepID=UPI002647404A|nr:tRNA (adenosine(37)-N6)-threonylcarbamoyltransferase complex dimerization subunit type 1 TsaB [Corynebacterium flavescens]MDN6431130.1 tRNA (adenosine(37)-N6)-threonylcarbamoyltransferase complex dimerization subunit type 1 TsaB [Corynebacterium flavescens]MDN6475390.1 tRNA (adenosine(37)-N6)-threonylcarbamoyltransferase complex dimerization subunit type 1 TsaB [Corynebacterium flavescens]MDN6601462.1 tRNA (adenosine(37)-N6)-threonylcarbamoyltransferase complex dimerization subunit type 1 Tsa
MSVLAIDTATTDLVTGLVDPASGLIAERILKDTRAHNEMLIPTITELLEAAGMAFADIDAVVVGCGPGPFTGLRVGMATASAVGDALGVPVHGVCTHDAIGYATTGKVLVATDARRKEVYWAAYEEGKRIDGPEVCKPAILDTVAGTDVDAVIIPANLAAQLPESLRALPTHSAGPLPANLVVVADLQAQPAPLVPLYLRRPDAKEPAPKPRSSALSEVTK